MEARERARKPPGSARGVPVLVGLAALWCAPHCTTNSALDRARGQSGSEVVSNGGTGGSPGGNGTSVPGGEVVPCPCGFPATNESTAFATGERTASLRVTLLERTLQAFDSPAFSWCSASREPEPEPACARVRLRVEEVLSSNVALEVGDELEANTDGRLPCFVGTERVGVGDAALAQASWPPPDLPSCEAGDVCLGQCASDSGFDDECPPRPALSEEQVATTGSVRLTLWEDQILFAATDQAELRVPASELTELAEADAQCLQRYGNWHTLPGAFPDGQIP